MNAAGGYRGQRYPTAVDSILRQIGNTPLLRFTHLSRAFDRVNIFGKAEWFNPGGSVKDRPALRMIEGGGHDATSGLHD
jgi:S-sulfo-L-cysteine synthase (O-acetyl-L-serine-dependent)